MYGYRATGGIYTSNQDAFEHILASLHEAILEDARWPAASAVIDEACAPDDACRAPGKQP